MPGPSASGRWKTYPFVPPAMKHFIFIHHFLFYKQKEHLPGFLRALTSHSRRATLRLWLRARKGGEGWRCGKSWFEEMEVSGGWEGRAQGDV